jgi:hypothetical protein
MKKFQERIRHSVWLSILFFIPFMIIVDAAISYLFGDLTIKSVTRGVFQGILFGILNADPYGIRKTGKQEKPADKRTGLL